MTRLKGKDTFLLVDGEVVASSTSCSLEVSANTTDASSKDDVSPLFDNPEFVNYSWNASNESFVTDANGLKALMGAWLSGHTVDVTVAFGDDDGFSRTGSAFITNISATASVSDKGKLSVSFTGNGVLSAETAAAASEEEHSNENTL